MSQAFEQLVRHLRRKLGLCGADVCDRFGHALAGVDYQRPEPRERTSGPGRGSSLGEGHQVSHVFLGEFVCLLRDLAELWDAGLYGLLLFVRKGGRFVVECLCVAVDDGMESRLEQGYLEFVNAFAWTIPHFLVKFRCRNSRNGGQDNPRERFDNQ